jgi:hypothetical protein
MPVGKVRGIHTPGERRAVPARRMSSQFRRSLGAKTSLPGKGRFPGGHLGEGRLDGDGQGGEDAGFLVLEPAEDLSGQRLKGSAQLPGLRGS